MAKQPLSEKEKLCIGKAYIEQVRNGDKTAAQFAQDFNIGERTARTYAAMVSGGKQTKAETKKTKSKAKVSKPKAEAKPKQSQSSYNVALFTNKAYIVFESESGAQTKIVNGDSEAFETIKELVSKHGVSSDVYAQFFETERVKQYSITTNNRVNIEIGENRTIKMRIDGKEIKQSALASLIVAKVNSGRMVEANTLINFIDLLSLQPNERVFAQLFDFMQYNSIKLDEDGWVIAYKVVNKDYTDCYTGTIANNVGVTVSMNRKLVDNDPHQTCSHGLHVCASAYIPSFMKGKEGARVVKVKVHPMDFVSIPVDYKGAKARVCSYKVVEDVTESIVSIIKSDKE